jgi:uncharacterized protein (TIGR04255 family)
MPNDKPKYTNPPIQEAVFEVHFAIDQPLSKETLEILQPVWQESYPVQKIVEEKNLNLRLDPDGIKTDQQILGHRLVCRSDDGKRLVQLSSSFLAVNQLKPYPGWDESFRETIVQRVNEFQKTVGPLSLRQVALRYINKIDIPEAPLVWEKWFQFSLPLPKLAGAEPPNFQMQFNLGIADECRLSVNAVALPQTQPKTSSIILDIGVAWTGTPIEPSKLNEYMEKVHRPHRLAFEGYLNDNLRSLFY